MSLSHRAQTAAPLFAVMGVSCLVVTVFMKGAPPAAPPGMAVLGVDDPIPAGPKPAAKAEPEPDDDPPPAEYAELPTDRLRWHKLTPGAPPAGESAERPIDLPGVSANEDHFAGFVVSEESRRAAVIYVSWPKRGPSRPTTRLLVCDLAEGRVVSNRTFR